MGLEYARQLAEKGYDLLLVSNREEELESAVSALSEQYPVKVEGHFQDLAQPDAADALFACCQGRGLVPDVLVNNAGMFFFKELSRADLDRVQAMLNLHVSTITRLSILFGEAMKQRGSGYILIVSSMAARLPVPGITLYAATKAYLRSFGLSLSYELRPYGVGVTTVCPSAIATPLYKLKPSLMDMGVRIRLIHTPEWLVRRSLKAMFRRRRKVSPSAMNVWLPPLIAILPVQAIWKRFSSAK